MRIGLIDVDSHNFPNLPLMKLSAYHKQAGDLVEFVRWDDQGNSLPYDRIYMSKVFTESKEPQGRLLSNDIRRGGSGYNLYNTLPDEVEHIYPDYSLYPDYDFALGFLTRGCPRCNHTFCITPKKDGTVSRKVADLSEFWRGQEKIVLLDQNLLACKDRMELLTQLSRSNAKVEFNGGLDIRYLNIKVAFALRRVKFSTMLHLAWDDPKEDLYDKFVMFKEKKIHPLCHTSVYVLVNFWSSFEDDMRRIKALSGLGYVPFVMIYDKQKFVDDRGRWLPGVAEKYSEEDLRHFKRCQHLQRWCNNRYVFKSTPEFNDYGRYRNWVNQGMPVPQRS